MSDHISQEQMTSYLHGRLRPQNLLAFDDHLSGCSACRQFVLSLRGASPDALATAIRNPSSDHPSYDALERLVDGTAGRADRRDIEQHLSECPACSAETEDLRRFAGTPNVRYWAVAAAAVFFLIAIGLVTINRPAPPAPPIPAARPRTVLHDRSGTISIDSTGELAGAPAGFAPLVRDLLARPELPQPSVLRTLSIGGGGLRGRSETSSFQITAPAGKVLLEDRPLFSWAGLAAAIYEVEVFDETFQSVGRSGRVKGTEWRPSEPLPRGRILLWQVKQGGLTAPRPPDPPARFLIADEDSARQIAAAQQSRSHLLLGSLYARAGMRDEAEAELRELVRLNPESEIAKRLLMSVQQWSR